VKIKYQAYVALHFDCYWTFYQKSKTYTLWLEKLEQERVCPSRRVLFWLFLHVWSITGFSHRYVWSTMNRKTKYNINLLV